MEISEALESSHTILGFNDPGEEAIWKPAFSPFPTMFSGLPQTNFSTVKPGLETFCIKQSPALRDQCFDTTPLLNPFPHNDTF